MSLLEDEVRSVLHLTEDVASIATLVFSSLWLLAKKRVWSRTLSSAKPDLDCGGKM